MTNDRKATLCYEQKGIESVEQIVERIKRRGLKEIRVRGDEDLVRSLSLQALLVGIKVPDFTPSDKEKALLDSCPKPPGDERAQMKKANTVVRDYELRVIPALEKDYEEARKAHTKSMNWRLLRHEKEAATRNVGKCAERILRAKEAQAEFLPYGNKNVLVNQNIEDGVARWTLDPRSRRREKDRERSR